MKSLAILTSLVVAAAAAPGLQSADYVNTFANATGGAFIGGAGSATIPGTWQALNWQGMSVYGYCLGQCIIPYNSYYYAGTYTGKPSIAAAYNGSRVLYFDLKSIYLGCSSRFQTDRFGEITYPAKCNITFKGYATDSPLIPVATTTFDYEPDVATSIKGLPYALQKHFTFPSTFSRLRRVEFSITSVGNYSDMGAGTANATGTPTGYLDDVAYRVTNISLFKE